MTKPCGRDPWRTYPKPAGGINLWGVIFLIALTVAIWAGACYVMGCTMHVHFHNHQAARTQTALDNDVDSIMENLNAGNVEEENNLGGPVGSSRGPD